MLIRLAPLLKYPLWILLLGLPSIGATESRIDALKRCLGDFDGIEWKLPYQPPVRIRSCASETVTYDTHEKTTAGRRSLELIGELTVGPDIGHLSSDETEAAVHEAMFAHFDALFRRHGYRRTEVGYGDARTRRYLNTMRMLRGAGSLPEDEAQRDAKRVEAEPPIPYINLARYVRTSEGRDVSLTYKTEAKNTWRISMEGLATAAPGAAR